MFHDAPFVFITLASDLFDEAVFLAASTFPLNSALLILCFLDS